MIAMHWNPLPMECMTIIMCLGLGMALGSWLDDHFGKK